LRAREEDMSESLKSKDTQLAVLRVRFEEMDSEIKSKNTEIEALKTESQRLLHLTFSSKLNNSLFICLK
jgi:hypothetical protein